MREFIDTFNSIVDYQGKTKEAMEELARVLSIL